MGGRTTRPQVPLYLDRDKVEAIDALAEKTGLSKQHLMRSAIDLMLRDYEWKRTRSPDGTHNVHQLVRRKRSK
jgi:predicted transcriptional regulator